MLNLRNPKWLFLINTLPVIVLFLLFIGEFKVIKSLLKEENLHLWLTFGLTLGILGSLNFCYTCWLIFKKQSVSVVYAFAALLCYIPFIYVFSFHSDQIIPFSIPRWMLSGDNLVYVGTFLMPTLAYALIIIVIHFTANTNEHKAWKNFLIALAIPTSWYLFSLILLPLWKPATSNFDIHVVVIMFIATTLVFLFFLVRSIWIIVTKKTATWQKYQLAWKIPISLVLPLIGLAVNNGDLPNGFGKSGIYIFGDFSNFWFYLLAILNGIFICLPNLTNKTYRFILFLTRSITFAYTFYFFLVFLPYLPLSIAAIVGIGIGFLMLSPLFLFVLHVSELSKDFSWLKNYFSTAVLWILALAGFLVIPLFVTGSYLKDKGVLTETLNYLYTPDYSKSYKLDKASLRKTLTTIEHYKDGNPGEFFGRQIPYLSSYFNWLVLSNQTLSDAKINNIENVFFGNLPFEMRSESIRNDQVKISRVFTKSTYDKTQHAWLSWVDLELANQSDHSGFAEYAAILNLPEGAWICDYYLYVGKKKEMGLLAEKKSAMWVFSNIRNENRDPGILYYLTGNKVAFRVFPFAKNEVRKTGIQILHKEPISFTIGENLIKLGDEEQPTGSETDVNNNVGYVPASQKKNFKLVWRRPYLHFLVDVSGTKNKKMNDYSKRIDLVLQNYKSISKDSKISFVNSYVNTIPLKSDWRQIYKSQNFEGGFYLDRGIRTSLVTAYKNNSAAYPVFVVVTDTMGDAIIDRDFSDLKMTFPESDLFFSAKSNGKLQAHSLTLNPMEQVRDTISYNFSVPVLEYLVGNKKFYFPDNNQPNIVLKSDMFDLADADFKEKNWQSALTMHGKWESQTLHPETSQSEWLNLVKYSFLSKVMTPVTSYLVVENEAQKAILKKKQEEVLSANKSLDPGEDMQRMSEPGLGLLALVLALVLWYKKRQRTPTV